MKRWLICLMSLLLLVGFSSSVLAISDPADDSLLAPYEIVGGEVILYEPVAEPGELYAKVKLTMEAGTGKLPGVVMVEFDVDGDTTTGSGGMHWFMGACQGGGPIAAKVQGTDISFMIVLDAQANTATTAWCDGCTGSFGQCYPRTAACDGACGGTNCFPIAEITQCDPAVAAPNTCFMPGVNCQEDTICDSCYELTVECDEENNCGQGKLRGEYYVTKFDPSQMSEPFLARGRIEMPLPAQGGPNATEGVSLCITLPYSRILRDIKATGANYDAVASINNPASARWHMHAWEDGVVGGEDHLRTDPSSCAQVVDKIPNDGNVLVTVLDACKGDFNEDGMVTGAELGQFAVDFGRQDCPNCK